jgi:hypothetical protein
LDVLGGLTNELLDHGIELVMVPFWLIPLGGCLLIIYLFFDLYCVIANREHKSHKLISVILVCTAFVFLFLVFSGGKPQLGYWVINLGILSSAVLEWQK